MSSNETPHIPTSAQPVSYGQPFEYSDQGMHLGARQSGIKYWGLGLLWLIPLLGTVAVPVVLGVLAAQVRQDPNPVVRENSRWAANWTFTATALVTFAYVVIIVERIPLLILNSGESVPQLTPITALADILIWAVVIGHIVISIIGMSIARTRVLNPRVAIPFISSTRSL